MFGGLRMCKSFNLEKLVEELEKLNENLRKINEPIDDFFKTLDSRLEDQKQRQNFIDLFDAQIRLERLKIEEEKVKIRQKHITINILICAICASCVVILTCLITNDNSNLIHYIHEYVFRGI